MRRVLIAALVVCGACVDSEGVPPGKIAVVGDVVLGADDLAGIQAQLGAYAQLRFSGGEGRAALVNAVVTAELLAQEATDNGLGDDPRVRFAVLEEIANVYLAAELERRVPRATVAADTAALREHYDAHLSEFMQPETRSVQGVFFFNVDDADHALKQLKAGTAKLKELGEVIATPEQSRDDKEQPSYHPILFGEGLGVGDWLPAPVIMGTVVVAGRVAAINPASPLPFDDPGVQERLVVAVRAPRVAKAKKELMDELAQRFPESAP